MLRKRLTTKHLKAATLNFVLTYLVVLAALTVAAIAAPRTVSESAVVLFPIEAAAFAAFAAVFGKAPTRVFSRSTWAAIVRRLKRH